jgi:hypothetical protein
VVTGLSVANLTLLCRNIRDSGRDIVGSSCIVDVEVDWGRGHGATTLSNLGL